MGSSRLVDWSAPQLPNRAGASNILGSLKMAVPVILACGFVDYSANAYLDATSPGGRIAKLITDVPFVHRHRERGDYLFRVGAAFRFLYVINAGFVKTCYVSEDGRAQTTDLHLRGDILGLDAVATATYGCDAVALEACDVLAIPYEVVIKSGQQNSDLVRELYLAFSMEIRSDRNLMLNMRSLSAAGRVAGFLLKMSARFASRGFSATELQLRLSRQEIGSILGLELETVSRAFSHFAQLGLISVCLREIVLLDRAGLQDIIAPPAGSRRDREKDSSRNFISRAHGYPLAVLVE